MSGSSHRLNNRMLRWTLTAVAGMAAMMPVFMSAGGTATAGPAVGGRENPLGGQQFEDVPDTNPFAPFINALAVDAIVSGYSCGGAGEPCVPPDNRPYYRPNNLVTRSQMSKFVENGRRNIDDAVGLRLVMTNTAQPSLVISSTTTDGIDVRNASGLEAVDSRCTRAGVPCYAFYSVVVAGNRAAVFTGGRGAYMSSEDDTYPGADISSNGATAYAAEINASDYRAAHIEGADGWNDLVVDGTVTVGEFNGAVRINGDLTVTGSKTGYVVDVMQNVGDGPLEAGDLVVVVGNSPAVLGEIPVVTVRRASGAYDTGVVGVVDQVLYVPDAATKAQYLAEQAAVKEALNRRAAAEAQAAALGDGSRPAEIEVPARTISDDRGTVHADKDATQAAVGAYINVVTLGSYKAVKVDASFGAIKAGDLLTTSPNPGYAMKATDKLQAMGAVVGKALGNLDSGTGLVPVMVTLK